MRAHGGTVEKFIGDAVMAVFGVPTAHDDDAERAIRAAFACRARILELNRSARFAIELRIGVNSGEAVAGTDQADHFLVTGTPVSLAARLQQAASPGQVLVGALTRTLTGGGVSYGPARVVEGKGVGSVTAFSAEALTSAVPEQHRGIAGHRASLVGRASELQLLQDARSRVANEGSPTIVTIYGSPGAGKSRLTAEFVQLVGHENARTGRCLPYGAGVTLYPIQQILRDDLDIKLTATREAAQQSLRAGVIGLFDDRAEGERVAVRLEVILGLADPSGLGLQAAPGEIAEELLWGVRRFFERRAENGPLVLVFEDVHWGDAAMLDLIEHLAEWARAQILIVALARPEFRVIRPVWGSGAANAISVTLAPLTAADTLQLLAELVPNEALPEEVRAELLTRAEGNPLYVEEFLRMLIDSGRIGEGRWVGTSTSLSLEVPPTVQGVIAARIDLVPADVKQVLQQASLVGRHFSTSALSAIGGAPASNELLREAIRRELIVEARAPTPGEGRVYRFKHVLIRDVTYGTIPKVERARMHENYARWLEQAFGDRREEFGELRAYHAEQAFWLAHELGRDEAPLLGERALDLLLAVAKRAFSLQDRSALPSYDRAAAIADVLPATLAKRAEARGFAAIERYFLKRDESDLVAVLALCEEAGPSEVLVNLLMRLADANNQQGRRDIGLAMWERALDVARSVGDAELIAMALTSHAMGVYQTLGDVPSARRLLGDAREYMQTTGAKRALMRCLSLLSGMALDEGDYTEARRYIEELDSELPADRSWLADVTIHERWSQYHLDVGAADAAVGAAELALAAARKGSRPGRTALAAWRLGDALLEVGEAAKARVVLEEGTAIFQSRRQHGQLPELAARCARACSRLHDVAAARQYVDLAERTAQQGDVEVEAAIATARAELANSELDAAAADAAYCKALAVLESSYFGNLLAQTRIAYARFLISGARFGDAREQLGAARDLYHDPLAGLRREQIRALLERCEVGAV